MLEIMTITDSLAHLFDRDVNKAIAEGWTLVRRECIVTGADRAKTFYAELERDVDEPEEEEDQSDNNAEWIVTRNPRDPYRCSACGYNTNAPWPICPNCHRKME